MSETLNIVLGNPLVTYQGVHYASKNGCDTDENTEPGDEEGASCEPKPAPVPKLPSDIVYINRQISAISMGLRSAEFELRARIMEAFPGNKEVGVICADQFALRDLVKDGEFHRQFGKRFEPKTRKKLGECGPLISDVRDKLRLALDRVRLFVQLDHSDNVKNYLNPDSFNALVETYAGGSRTSFKNALIDAPLLTTGINLSQLLPQVTNQFHVPLEDTCFNPEDVSVIFERVIRDHLHRMAVLFDWDESVNTSEATKKPFYVPELGEEPRNAINFVGADGKPVVACIGVVSGVPGLIAYQSDGGVVRMFMEPDSHKRRVDPKIIRAGLDFYDEVIASAESLPADKNHQEIPAPTRVRTELFMTQTEAAQVLVGK